METIDLIFIVTGFLFLAALVIGMINPKFVKCDFRKEVVLICSLLIIATAVTKLWWF